MAKLMFELDDELLEEVNNILDSVGLDLDIAFSIFARKIVKEKGLPFNVRQKHDENTNESTYNDNSFSPQLGSRRTNNAITIEMIEEVWSAFIKVKDGYFDVREMADYISEKSGMNYGSATIYLNILMNLSNGEINKRSMKPSDFEFFIDKIKKNLGETAYQKALHSIEVSIPYWNRNIPTFANSMIDLLKKQNKMVPNESGQKTFNKNADKIDITNVLNRFEKYLESIGYSAVTPSGLGSTTIDYAQRRIPFVLKSENINIKELIVDIDSYIKIYDFGGIKEDLGKKSNRAVINALKRFKEFLKNEGL